MTGHLQPWKLGGQPRIQRGGRKRCKSEQGGFEGELCCELAASEMASHIWEDLTIFQYI